MSQPNPQDPFGFLRGEPGESDPAAATDLQDATTAAELKNLEIFRMIHQVMNEGRGPEFMEWLRSVTVETPLTQIIGHFGPANDVTMSMAEWALYRDGQNSFYHLIKACIKAAEDGAATSADATEQANDGS